MGLARLAQLAWDLVVPAGLATASAWWWVELDFTAAAAGTDLLGPGLLGCAVDVSAEADSHPQGTPPAMADSHPQAGSHSPFLADMD